MIYGDYKTVMICSECLSFTSFFLFLIFLLFHAEFRVEWRFSTDGSKISRLYSTDCKVLAGQTH